jgi:hypothetical protein
MQFIISFLLKAAKTAALKRLLLEAAQLLVERTDTTFDDRALDVVREVLSGA